MLYFLLLWLFYLFSFPSVELFSPEWLSNKERKPALRLGGTDTSVSLRSCLSSNPFLVAWNIWMVMKRHEQVPDNQPREKNTAKRKATNVSGCVLFQSYFSTTLVFFVFFSLNLLLCSVYFMPVSDGDGSVEMAGNEEEKQGCGTEDAGWIWARGSSWLESFD